MTVSGWVDVVTFSSGFEADLAVAQLEAAGIRAVRDSNDTVGIFGPGFQGATARGVTVRVPADALDAARAVLAPAEGAA
jgi:Putative prokaryotic signal transducing protein